MTKLKNIATASANADKVLSKKLEKIRKLYAETNNAYIYEILLERIDDLMDLPEIMKRSEDYKKGKSQSIPHEEAMKSIGLR